jgi:hypothetical protein
VSVQYVELLASGAKSEVAMDNNTERKGEREVRFMIGHYNYRCREMTRILDLPEFEKRTQERSKSVMRNC